MKLACFNNDSCRVVMPAWPETDLLKFKTLQMVQRKMKGNFYPVKKKGAVDGRRVYLAAHYSPNSCFFSPIYISTRFAFNGI